MQHLSYYIDSLETLKDLLSFEVIKNYDSSKGLLVQVYSSRLDNSWIENITHCILKVLPKATVVGSTTVGEVLDGRSVTNTTAVGFTFFEKTELKVFAKECEEDQEFQLAKGIAEEIARDEEDTAGVLLLCTPLSLDASKLLQGFQDAKISYPLFGGGAGDYASMNSSLVFCNDGNFTKGVVVVAFKSQDLMIDIYSYLGWKPLSKEMTITQVENMSVKSIDNRPACEIYEKYLGISKNDNFFENVLEFPFLIKRDNELLARVPVLVDKDNGIQFIADIQKGERFQIGYGDPELIISDASAIHQKIASLDPEIVFLYTCGCRRFLMQESANMETLPFEEIAPTFGFYTYGEFFGKNSEMKLLNSTMVVVSMRERENRGLEKKNSDKTRKKVSDPYANQHGRIISRLIHFIEAVSDELEERNRENLKLSETDPLTKISNRLKLDNMLNYCLSYAKRYHEPLSIVMIDIDYFKRVNDEFGHLVGDKVLIEISALLKKITRDTDIVGRWGGEEFLLILPKTELDNALILAEKLRKEIKGLDLAEVGNKTASFGVASFRVTDSIDTLIQRADDALYKAKREGRDKVVEFR